MRHVLQQRAGGTYLLSDSLGRSGDSKSEFSGCFSLSFFSGGGGEAIARKVKETEEGDSRQGKGGQMDTDGPLRGILTGSWGDR